MLPKTMVASSWVLDGRDYIIIPRGRARLTPFLVSGFPDALQYSLQVACGRLEWQSPEAVVTGEP